MGVLSQKSGKSPEKWSNFALTCNLLSQYLKNGGSFGDISLALNEGKGCDLARPHATAMNHWINGGVASANSKLNILPQNASFGSPNISEETNKADLRRSVPIEPEATQMTIFYGGQVIVFDDFLADKAKKIMDLANKSSSSGSNGFLPTTTFEKIDLNNPVTSYPSNFKEDQLQPQAHASSDLPLARKASLRTFLEKRKDRVANRGPYQINKHSDLGPPRSKESSPWIDLEALSSRHLELRL